MAEKIKFNKPWLTGKELEYVKRALASGDLAGDKSFSKQCQTFMEQRFGAQKVLLTTSCTSALEMAALLCDIQPGDEVIMPSFTFVSTANAFLLRGAKIKFVDIREDTFNLDETLITDAITSKTKAIVPVHYASIGCEMATINKIAEQHGLYVIEDAAQAVDTQYQGQYLGTIGDVGAYSFHETKNFVAGEAGALIINRPEWIERAEIMREKGTNRSQFVRGQVDKYTWVDVGSSYVPSDMLAAVLLAQLENMDEITDKRQQVASYYSEHLQPLAEQGFFQLPLIPGGCTSNHHMFSLYCSSPKLRDKLLTELNAANVQAVFHYIPLHNSPFAQQQQLCERPLPITEKVSANLLRLPMHPGLTEAEVDYICKTIERVCLDPL